MQFYAAVSRVRAHRVNCASSDRYGRVTAFPRDQSSAPSWALSVLERRIERSIGSSSSDGIAINEIICSRKSFVEGWTSLYSNSTFGRDRTPSSPTSAMRLTTDRSTQLKGMRSSPWRQAAD